MPSSAEGDAASSMPKCALCLRRKPLCKSHIVPEWCYRPSYDAKHRGIECSSRSPEQHFLQKGKRQPLLCEECDNVVLGKYETQFKEFWFDRQALPHLVNGRSVSVDGADYTLCKLFHLSILWRAGVSSLPEFANVSLGPHADRLRQMLLTGDAGAEEAYAVIGFVIVLDNREVVYDLITGPIRSRKGAFTTYFMCYAGCEWYFIVNQRCSPEHHKLAIRKGCPLELGVMSLKDVKSLNYALKDLATSHARQEESLSHGRRRSGHGT